MCKRHVFLYRSRRLLNSSFLKSCSRQHVFSPIDDDFKIREDVMHICMQQSSNLIIGKYLSLSSNDKSINYPYWFLLKEIKLIRCKLGATDKASLYCRIQIDKF